MTFATCLLVAKPRFWASAIAGLLVDLQMIDFGLTEYRRRTDLYPTVTLEPGSLMVVHTEGEQAYADMVRGNPPTFNRSGRAAVDRLRSRCSVSADNGGRLNDALNGAHCHHRL